MLRKDVAEKVKEIIVGVLDNVCRVEDIEGTNLITELGINSIDAMEILVLVEEEFEIRIEDEDLNADLLQSIDSLTDYITARCE